MGQPTSYHSRSVKGELLSGNGAAELAPDGKDRRIVGTWEWDVRRDVLKACEVTRALFGISHSENCGELPLWRFVQAMHRSDRKRFGTLIELACKEGGTFEAEYRTHPAPGATCRVMARGQFFADASGIVERGQGVVIDVTRAASAHRKPAKMCGNGPDALVAPLARVADHLISAWEISRAMAPEDFDAIQTTFRALMLELGVRIAKAESKTPSVRTTKRPDLH